MEAVKIMGCYVETYPSFEKTNRRITCEPTDLFSPTGERLWREWRADNLYIKLEQQSGQTFFARY